MRTSYCLVNHALEESFSWNVFHSSSSLIYFMMLYCERRYIFIRIGIQKDWRLIKMRFSIQVFIKLYSVKYAVIQCVKVVLRY